MVFLLLFVLQDIESNISEETKTNEFMKLNWLPMVWLEKSTRFGSEFASSVDTFCCCISFDFD